MTKRLWIFVLVLALPFLLSACTKKVDLSRLTAADHSGMQEDEDIFLTMDYAEYSQEDPQIYWILENENEKDICFARAEVEYLSGETWYTLPVKEDVIFTTELTGLFQGGRTSGKIDKEIYDFSFPIGRYRVVLPYWYGDEYQEADHIVTAEFEIVKKAERVEYQQFVEQLYDQEPGLKNGLVIVKDQLQGQEVIDRFLDRSLCGVPTEMRIIYPEEDIIQHYYYLNGCYTVQEYIDRAVITHCYSYLYFDPEIEEIFLSNYVDPDEAKKEGFMVYEPEEIFQLGPASEEAVNWIREETDFQNEVSAVFMKVYLYGYGRYAVLIQDEEGIRIGYQNESQGAILQTYSKEELHPVSLRAFNETTAVVLLEDSDGRTSQVFLNVKTGEIEE